jgi:hypothetical protein
VQNSAKDGCVELYPLGHKLHSLAEIEAKFHFTVRPATTDEAYPAGHSADPPSTEQVQRWIAANTVEFGLWPSTVVNPHPHRREKTAALVLVTNIQPPTGHHNIGEEFDADDGKTHYIAVSGIGRHIAFYHFVDDIADEKWTALNDPANATYGPPACQEIWTPATRVPGFISAISRCTPGTERSHIWGTMLANPQAITYMMRDDAVVKAKVDMLKAHAQARFNAPWPLYDASFWTYVDKQRKHAPARQGRYTMIE